MMSFKVLVTVTGLLFSLSALAAGKYWWWTMMMMNHPRPRVSFCILYMSGFPPIIFRNNVLVFLAKHFRLNYSINRLQLRLVLSHPSHQYPLSLIIILSTFINLINALIILLSRCDIIWARVTLLNENKCFLFFFSHP